MEKFLARTLATLLTTTALCATALLTGPSAAASAQGCTQSELDGKPALLCHAVWGKGAYVSDMEASADFTGHTCDGRFKLWGTLSNGKAWSYSGWAKCATGRSWIKIKVKKNFKKGTKTCGAIVRPTGAVRKEHACVKIK